ncbi:hypothetical protein PUN28_005095 [Cardiocondyla obscurior]|uniref:Exosome complex component 10 homolog n=1 Tax=Cardiocondyla obscurior TaxID=286306 RepID=A0AAW2GK35_9HYME
MELAENQNDDASVSQNDDVVIEGDEQPNRLVPGYATFDDFVQDAFDVMRAGIKAANNLPIGDNFNYYACFPSFNDARQKDTERILDTMQSIMKLAKIPSNIKIRNLEEKFDLLIETNDQLLDQANILMDEESGIIRNPQVELVMSQMPKPFVNGSWNVKANVNQNSDGSDKVRLLGAKNIQRPQLMFKDKIDNSMKPWVPRIKDKPNSLTPLALYVDECEQNEVFNHPYEFELDKFEIPKNQLKKRTPTKYKPLEDTKLVFIDKPAHLKALLDDLRRRKEIAIDLEHHSYRTFQGITCLMQISTTEIDYLIDTLALRSELHQLNEIFTKPSILKVFHGADSDILWLQRDLSLYIVNMFDTHQAAKQLNLPYLRLAYLLSKYCGVVANKLFQWADWRIRPLTTEMMKYAREDTHYLLYIKDMLTNELIDIANGKSNILKSVYDESTEICKRIYMKPIWTEESCMHMYRKSHMLFNNKQMYALVELHRWRDLTAREEDDSTDYVLPNQMLLNIAKTLPREMQGILACWHRIPPLVRQNLLKIHKIVLKARDQPLVKSIPEQNIRQRPMHQNHETDIGISLYIPHDIPSGTEARADLPCLLDKINMSKSLPKENTCQVKHSITIFDTPVTSEDELESENSNRKKKKTIFISPYMRYKCVIPMVINEEAKEREKQKKEEEKEENLTVRTEVDRINDDEINESINRVHEHFKKVTQINTQVEVPSKKKKKKNKQFKTINQIKGAKRKKNFDIANEKWNTNNDSNAEHLSKRLKPETSGEQKMQNSFAQASNSNTEAPCTIRPRKKGEKKANAKMLKKQGMLPSEKFDYKSVDFNSFQGGSTQSSANSTKFQHQQKKKQKQRPNQRWKMQKFNI